MKTVRLQGMRPLEGTVTVGGAKNAALPVLFATLLVQGRSYIQNLPDIGDVRVALELLRSLGAEITVPCPHEVIVDTEAVGGGDCPCEAVGRLRGSAYLLGALLGRRGYATVGLPGGCALGDRPVDRHLEAFRALGAETCVDNDRICVRAESLTGGKIVFRKTSVGGTVNALLAAVAAPGVTTVEGAAVEPYVGCLCRYLNRCGACIEGADTDRLTVRGGRPLRGCSFSLMGDMMEAGTYLLMAAQTGGEVRVRGADPAHLESLLGVLRETGVTLSVEGDGILVKGEGRPLPVSVVTGPYPAFPTDLHPSLVSYLLRGKGTSAVRETVWPDRFRYAEELRRLGGQAETEGDRITVVGTHTLHGACLTAPDLRGGAALVGAGLAAMGETVIRRFELVERGYEDMVGKLTSLGARISYV